jgi:hypothetical protein
MEKTFRDSPIWKHRPHVELRLAGAKRYKRLSWTAVAFFAGGGILSWMGSRVNSAEVFVVGLVVAVLSYIMVQRWVGRHRLYDQSVQDADREFNGLADAIGIPVTILAENFWPPEVEEAGKQELCRMIDELLAFEEKAAQLGSSMFDLEMRRFWDESVGNSSHERATEIFALYDLLARFFLSVEKDGINSYYTLMEEARKKTDQKSRVAVS